MLGKGLVRVRGRSDDGQMMVRWSLECQGKPGERQVNFLFEGFNCSLFSEFVFDIYLDLYLMYLTFEIVDSIGS